MLKPNSNFVVHWEGLTLAGSNRRWVNVSCVFVIYGLYYFEVCSLYAHLLEKFIINGCQILSKAFSAIYWDDHMVFIFNLLMWCITLIDLRILKNSCNSGLNLTWSWYMIFLIYCWIQSVIICWGFFHLCSSVILNSNLFCDIFVWF